RIHRRSRWQKEVRSISLRGLRWDPRGLRRGSKLQWLLFDVATAARTRRLFTVRDPHRALPGIPGSCISLGDGHASRAEPVETVAGKPDAEARYVFCHRNSFRFARAVPRLRAQGSCHHADLHRVPASQLLDTVALQRAFCPGAGTDVADAEEAHAAAGT